VSERRTEIQVGAAFILSLVILVSGVLWFKEFRIGGKEVVITVEFENTSGLQKGDPVEVRGVNSGSVKDIRFTEGRALVDLSLDRGVAIHRDTHFVIENVGIMGQKMVAVYPGSQGPPLPPEVVLRGEYNPGIPGLMAGLASALENFEKLAIRLDTLLGAFDEAEQGSLTRILNNTDRVTANLADLLDSTRTDLAATVSSFNRAMTSLHASLEGREEDIGRAVQNAADAAARLDSVLARTDETLDRANRLLAGVEEGDGTLGLLANDDQLYHELRDTLQEARLLIEDVKADPRKYLKFSIF